MARIDVIKKFIKKERGTSGARDIWTGGHVASISTDGTTLYSYWTPIARWDGAGVRVNKQKYSSTTSRQQSELLRELERAGVAVLEWGE